MKRRSPKTCRRDRGAAAVEFALVLPLLLLVIFGTIDFARALNAQITLTEAAREGARLEALGEPNVVSRTESDAAVLGLSSVTASVTVPCTTGSGPTDTGTVQASYQFSFVTPVGAFAAIFGGSGFGSPITLTAEGVMPCET